MVKNLVCDFSPNDLKSPFFRVKWEWLYDGGALPSFRLYYRSIEEDEIFDNLLFDGRSIYNYVSNELDEYGGLEECFKRGLYKATSFELRRTDNISREEKVYVNFNCVYFFCMADESGQIFERFVRKSSNDTDVKFSVAKRMFTKKQEIKLMEKTSKRVFLQCERGGTVSYSLLPPGYQTLYIDSDAGNVSLVYLTTLLRI